jgi:hypothetical protein
MFGLTDFVLVTTVNALPPTGKPTDFFSTRPTVRLALDQTVSQDIPGNQRIRTNIDRQSYPHASATTVRQVFGLTGANFDNYVAYRSWKKLGLDDLVNNREEIILISKALNNINLPYIASLLAKQRILPDRFDR